MVLATKELGTLGRQSFTLERHSDQSESGANITVSTPLGKARRILEVTINYSAPASVSVTITLNSGAGPAFDTVHKTIVLSVATEGVWRPEEDWIIHEDDVVDVFAPLLAAQISSVTIYSELM